MLQVNGITGETFSYRDVDNAICHVASGLNRLGVRHGDVVACFSPNSHDYIFMLFAAMCNGAPVAVINSSYTACELTSMFFFFAELTNLNVFVWCGPDRSMSGWHSGCCCYKVLKFFLECWVERCKEFNAGIFTVETMWFSTVILTLKIPESFFSEEFYPSNWHVAVDIVYCLV